MFAADVCCFSPLKRRWEALLAERGNILGPRETITKSTFVDLLCSIFHEGLSIQNAISGFKATGIFPVNKNMYPQNRFDPRLLKRYNIWFEMGKPEEIMEDLATSVNTPNKLRPENDKDTTLPAAETTNESFNIEQVNFTVASS